MYRYVFFIIAAQKKEIKTFSKTAVWRCRIFSFSSFNFGGICSVRRFYIFEISIKYPFFSSQYDLFQEEKTFFSRMAILVLFLTCWFTKLYGITTTVIVQDVNGYWNPRLYNVSADYLPLRVVDKCEETKVPAPSPPPLRRLVTTSKFAPCSWRVSRLGGSSFLFLSTCEASRLLAGWGVGWGCCSSWTGCLLGKLGSTRGRHVQ